MQQCFRRRVLAVSVVGLLAYARTSGAQHAPVSIGIGVGIDVPTSATIADPVVPVTRLAVTVAPGSGRVEWRGTATLRHGAAAVGPLSLGADGALPVTVLRVGRTSTLEALVGAGLGVYGVGGVSHRIGATVGSGLRIQTSRLVFGMETQRHWATRNYVGALSVGVHRSAPAVTSRFDSRPDSRLDLAAGSRRAAPARQ